MSLVVHEGEGEDEMTPQNTAHYGGAVYINDNVSPACKNKYFTKYTVQTECFLLAYKLGKAQESSS